MAPIVVQPQTNNIHIWGGSGEKPTTWENTLRAAAPSPRNPKGAIVLLPGQGGPSKFLSKVIMRPIYSFAGGAIDVSLASSSWVDLPGDHFFGHTDNHIVRQKDGSFAAMKSTFNWAPPPSSDPWQQLKIKEIRAPYPVEKSGRATGMIWRGAGAPLTWTKQGGVDVFHLDYQYPRPLDCSGNVETSLGKQCKTATKEEELWTCAGLDRPELYACPFTGYLYMTVAYFSGPYAEQPYAHDHMLLCSMNQGADWHVLHDSLGGPAPHVMTSTPNGRLFVYVWSWDDDGFFGRLHCSNLFDASKNQLPTIGLVKGSAVANGGDVQNGYELRFGTPRASTVVLAETVNGKTLTGRPPDPRAAGNSQQMSTPAISRASSDVSSSRVRISLGVRNEFSRVECAIVDVGVVDMADGPHIEPGSLRLADKIAAADRAHYSVLHGTFIDPDHIGTPADFTSNTSMFYWLEWPRPAWVVKAACAATVQGDLHILAYEAETFTIGHTIRKGDGTWPFHLGDVGAAVPGQKLLLNDPACATNPAGDLHLLIVGENSTLWHTVRQANGTWPHPFGSVQAAVPTHKPQVTWHASCACDGAGRLHVLALDASNRLWHTLRAADGSWPFPFGDVAAAVGGASVTAFRWTSCAASAAGELHVLLVDHDEGKLWDTIRHANGTWLNALGDVAASVPGTKPGAISYAACALGPAGDLHVLAIVDKTKELWHAVRNNNGTWTPWTIVQKAVPTPSRAPKLMSIACAMGADGVLHLLATDVDSATSNTNNRLRYTYRKADGTWPANFADVVSATPPSAIFPNAMWASYRFIDGWPSKPSAGGPLSVANGVKRTWKSFDPGGDYMSGGFFYHDGLNYVAQWTEDTGTYANIVHAQPLKIHPIPPVPHT